MEFNSYILRDIASIQTGPFGSQLHKKDYIVNGTPIITVEHLGENKIIHSNLPGVKKDDVKRLSKYILNKNDIVFSRVGSVDRRALVSEDEDGWLFSGRCLRVRVTSDLVDPVYLSYYFGLPAFKEYIRNIAVGATMPSINTKILSDIEVSLPDISIQKKIAKILYSIDSKIWINENIITKLDNLSQSLFKRWFIDFEFPNENGEPYRSRGGNMVNSEIGLIPKGWEVLNLNQFVDSVSESINKKSKQYAIFLNTSDILDGQVLKNDYSATSEMPGQAKKLIKKSDILFSEIRPANKRFAYIDFDAEDYVVSTKLMVLRTDEEIFSSKALYLFLKSNDTIKELQQVAESRSGTFPQITFKELSKFKFAIPKKELFEKKFKIIEKLVDYQQSLIRENISYTELRDTLLPKLLSGELELPTENEVTDNVPVP